MVATARPFLLDASRGVINAFSTFTEPHAGQLTSLRLACLS
jgi:hypothetical protein